MPISKSVNKYNIIFEYTIYKFDQTSREFTVVSKTYLDIKYFQKMRTLPYEKQWSFLTGHTTEPIFKLRVNGLSPVSR